MAATKRKRPTSPTPSPSPSPPPSPSPSSRKGKGKAPSSPLDKTSRRQLRATEKAALVAQSFAPPPPGSSERSPFPGAHRVGEPSSSSGTTGSPMTPRKKRKKEDPDTPVEEKRLARWRTSCSQAVEERVGRVLTQRFYLVDRERDGDELRETFKVLGSTGNIYTVTIDKMPSCDCPDALKGNHCKHILFVFLKVLNVSQYSNLYYQKALLSTELAEIFNAAPSAPSVLAAERIRQAYASASGTTTKDLPSPAAAPKRLPQEGDDCPICYDSMPVNSEDGLVFCKSCGNGLHKECFVRWAETPNGRSCVTCRAVWPHEIGGGGKGKGRAVGRAGAGAGEGGEEGEGEGEAVVQEGYINIAGLAGISPVRDTSTYYHGPRRGRRYWDVNEDLYL